MNLHVKENNNLKKLCPIAAEYINIDFFLKGVWINQ